MDISISTYGPAEPLYVLELAEGLAGVMRALNAFGQVMR